MRILMAVPKYPFPVVGGLERQAHELSKALAKRGHTVYAVSSRFERKQKDVELVDGVQVHRVKWIESRAVRFVIFPFSLSRVLVNAIKKADLVHVHNISWFGAFVTLFAKAMGKPVITKLPNIGEFGIPGIRGGLPGRLLIVLLKRSDSIAAMTPESMSELASIEYPSSRVLKVTNGIPMQVDSFSLRSSRCSSPPETVTVVFVGRLVAQKGIHDLLEAWAGVKARATHSVKLRLIGKGSQEETLRALALALDLGESVEFAGYCRNVWGELARADLFVLPSYGEGNSNAILEAMLAGLPVVATRLGGTAIQVGKEGRRFLVDPGDRNGLADRLLELIENDELRLSLGAAMRTRVERLFSIDYVAETYERAYQMIVAGQRERVGKLNPDLFQPN